MLEVVGSEAPHVHADRYVLFQRNPFAFFVFVADRTVHTHDFRTFHHVFQVMMVVVHADTTCNGAVFAERITATEAHHGVCVLAAFRQFAQELADGGECVAAVEVITVDDTERFFDDIFTHQYGMVRTPRLYTAFRASKTFGQCVQTLEYQLSRNLSFVF